METFLFSERSQSNQSCSKLKRVAWEIMPTTDQEGIVHADFRPLACGGVADKQRRFDGRGIIEHLEA